MKGLSVDHLERYQTADEMKSALLYAKYDSPYDYSSTELVPKTTAVMSGVEKKMVVTGKVETVSEEEQANEKRKLRILLAVEIIIVVVVFAVFFSFQL